MKEKTNKTRSWFFKIDNKIDKPMSGSVKKKR